MLSPVGPADLQLDDYGHIEASLDILLPYLIQKPPPVIARCQQAMASSQCMKQRSLDLNLSRLFSSSLRLPGRMAMFQRTPSLASRRVAAP